MFNSKLAAPRPTQPPAAVIAIRAGAHASRKADVDEADADEAAPARVRVWTPPNRRNEPTAKSGLSLPPPSLLRTRQEPAPEEATRLRERARARCCQRSLAVMFSLALGTLAGWATAILQRKNEQDSPHTSDGAIAGAAVFAGCMGILWCLSRTGPPPADGPDDAEL